VFVFWNPVSKKLLVNCMAERGRYRDESGGSGTRFEPNAKLGRVVDVSLCFKVIENERYIRSIFRTRFKYKDSVFNLSSPFVWVFLKEQESRIEFQKLLRRNL
jgi:hypothetical protein